MMREGYGVRLKALFVANTMVSVPFGLGSVLAPHLFLSLFGAKLGPAGAQMMQFAGAWLIGTGLLTWFARDVAGSEAGRGMTAALLAAYAVALVVSVRGQFAGVLNALGWMPVAIQALFVGGFGAELLRERGAAAPMAPQA